MTPDAGSRPLPLRILVTGASGLLGRELCGVLAARGHVVIALLHRARTLERNDGGAIPTRIFDGAAMPGAVALLDGDVAAERFGLGAEIAAGLDLIVHCAAVTAFTLPAATYDAVNVGGTAQALAFAASASPAVPLLYVSTAYVCGETAGVVEEAPAEGACFNNGYEASKAAAEALVLAAHRRGGRVAIARPAIVAGHSLTGAIGAFGGMYQLIRMVTEGRTGMLPASADCSLNLVPIDHVVAALTDIAERMAEADGRIFHLASSQPVSLAALEALAAEFPHLHRPRFVAPQSFDPARLSPRQRWLHEQLTAPFASYLRRSPGFVTDNIRALTGRVCPPTDAGYLRRLLKFAIQAGFLAMAEPQRTSG